MAKTLLLIWHSQTGATAAMVEALAAAAQQEGTGQLLVRSLRASEAIAADVLSADAVVFATPESLGSMSGQLKDFFDRNYYALLGRCEGMPYALIVCAGSDGHPTIAQLHRIATGLRLREVAAPILINTQAQSPEAIAAMKQLPESARLHARELGQGLAAGLLLGIY